MLLLAANSPSNSAVALPLVDTAVLLMRLHMESLVTRWSRRSLRARQDMDWTTKILLFKHFQDAGVDWLDAGVYLGLFSLSDAKLGGKKCASNSRPLLPARAKRLRTAGPAAAAAASSS